MLTYTAALLNACGRRSDFRDVASNLLLKLVTISNLGKTSKYPTKDNKR